MKRLSALIVLGVLAVSVATACGHDSSTGAAASGIRGSTGASAIAASSTGVTTTAAPPSATSDASVVPSSPVAVPSGLGGASQTPCRQFKQMDTDAEKALIDKVLAENPGSHLDGSPNVALGTAKLVCLASSKADTPVAVAIGVAAK